MNVALENRNIYEDFVMEKDILYFRVGDQGLVSFHGKNFNLKKRVSTEQMSKLVEDDFFFKANTDCYVNLKKVEGVRDNKVIFNQRDADSKHVIITKLREIRLKGLLSGKDLAESDDSLK
jgi:hypothetical protein